MKILIVKISSLGDVVHGLCVANRIKQARPEAVIDWVAGDAFAAIPDNADAVRTVYPFKRKEWGKGWNRPAVWKEVMAFLTRLREEEYDLCLDLQGLFRSGAITALSGAKRTAGFANAREGAARLYREKIDPGPDPHAVDKLLRALTLLDIEPPEEPDFTFTVPPQARTAAETTLKEQGVETPYLLFHTGARWKTKLWPEDNWRELAVNARQELGMPVVFTGAPEDRDTIDRIIGGHEGLFNLAGTGDLLHLTALIQRCRAMATVDSGPMHIAAAFRIPLAAVFGATSPARTGPYTNGPCLLYAPRSSCAPCLRRNCNTKLLCMDEHTPSKVLEGLKTLCP